MAISKIILNGVTQMDVTGKTVTSASMRSGVTALKNDGTDITGSLADMTLPSSASASSSGTSKATITPTSSAQYLNIPTGYNDTAQFYTIAAASGGSSNIVTGTFKGTTTGAAMDVDIPYTGSGYPIAFVIYPTEGTYNSNTGSFYNLLQRYACAFLAGIKSRTDTAPNYENSQITDNAYSLAHRFKNSTTNSTNYSVSAVSAAYVARNIDAASSSNSTTSTIVTFRAKNKISVYIASSSYGFAANIEYKYWIIYSS